MARLAGPALRLILMNQVVRKEDRTLHEPGGRQLPPALAKAVENLLKHDFAAQLPGGRIRATVKGEHAEHERLYAQYVRMRDRAMPGTRRQVERHEAHARVAKALAKLRAYEASHPQFPAMPK